MGGEKECEDGRGGSELDFPPHGGAIRGGSFRACIPSSADIWPLSGMPARPRVSLYFLVRAMYRTYRAHRIVGDCELKVAREIYGVKVWESAG